jgi:hypothetical protein
MSLAGSREAKGTDCVLVKHYEGAGNVDSEWKCDDCQLPLERGMRGKKAVIVAF